MVNDRNTVSYRSCRLSMQAIHSGYPCRPSMQAIHSGYASETKHFLKKRWKHCQKMRLDALIIFPIEWRHNIFIFIGKRLKYCKLSIMQAIHAGYPCRLFMQAIHSGYASETEHLLKKHWKQCQKMRRDALIIFPIEWCHNIVILIGKRLKYCKLSFMQAIHAGYSFRLFI